MADLADLAQEHIEKHSPLALAVRKVVPPPAEGRCLNCDAELEPGQRFCDADCLHDWEHAQERARVNGSSSWD